MLYIDAPEKKQDYGIKSKNFLENLLLNKRVFVVTDKDDRYGRQLADISNMIRYQLLKKIDNYVNLQNNRISM